MIGDLSGYTRYLSETEFDHAHAVLDGVFRVMWLRSNRRSTSRSWRETPSSIASRHGRTRPCHPAAVPMW